MRATHAQTTPCHWQQRRCAACILVAAYAVSPAPAVAGTADATAASSAVAAPEAFGDSCRSASTPGLASAVVEAPVTLQRSPWGGQQMPAEASTSFDLLLQGFGEPSFLQVGATKREGLIRDRFALAPRGPGVQLPPKRSTSSPAAVQPEDEQPDSGQAGSNNRTRPELASAVHAAHVTSFVPTTQASGTAGEEHSMHMSSSKSVPTDATASPHIGSFPAMRHVTDWSHRVPLLNSLKTRAQSATGVFSVRLFGEHPDEDNLRPRVSGRRRRSHAPQVSARILPRGA